MIKRVLVVSMVGLSLVGCVNNDTLSGMFIPLLKRNKYRMSAMAPSLMYVRYRFRAVMIPTLSAQLAVLYLVVSREILLVAEPGVLWLLQQGPLQVV